MTHPHHATPALIAQAIQQNAVNPMLASMSRHRAASASTAELMLQHGITDTNLPTPMLVTAIAAALKLRFGSEAPAFWDAVLMEIME